MRRALLFLAAIAVAVSGQDMGMGDSADRADFEKDVLPILQDRCFECHSDRKKKPKGGLRVDSKAFLLLGGKKGPVIIAGKPDRSPLYARCSLPEDHDDVMPPSGETLTKEQLATIRAWIAAGASFGSWTGKDGEAEHAVKRTDVDPDHQRDRLAIYRELEADAPDVAGAALKAAAEAGARVTPVVPGGKLLRVEWVDGAQAAGDGSLKALSGLRRNVAILSLGFTTVSDKALDEIAKMPNLVRLDLQRTKVTDAGLKKLAQAKPPRLRRLNLYGTNVTDAGLDTLATLPELAEVFVFGTKVTEGGVERLRSLRRGCTVHWKRELPEAEEPRADGEGGRRRR